MGGGVWKRGGSASPAQGVVLLRPSGCSLNVLVQLLATPPLTLLDAWYQICALIPRWIPIAIHTWWPSRLWSHMWEDEQHGWFGPPAWWTAVWYTRGENPPCRRCTTPSWPHQLPPCIDNDWAPGRRSNRCDRVDPKNALWLWCCGLPLWTPAVPMVFPQNQTSHWNIPTRKCVGWVWLVSIYWASASVGGGAWPTEILGMPGRPLPKYQKNVPWTCKSPARPHFFGGHWAAPIVMQHYNIWWETSCIQHSFFFFFWSGLQGPDAYSLWYGVVPKPSIGEGYL